MQYDYDIAAFAEPPFHAVPATPVINIGMPPQQSPEEASVPSFHEDQPETPVARALVVFRQSQRIAAAHQQTEQTPVQHRVPYAEYNNQNRHTANVDLFPSGISEQVVPCLPSPTLMPISPASTLSDSAATVSASEHYLTGTSASRQCILRKRLLTYSRFLKSQAVGHPQKKSVKNKQINLFAGDKIFG